MRSKLGLVIAYVVGVGLLAVLGVVGFFGFA